MNGDIGQNNDEPLSVRALQSWPFLEITKAGWESVDDRDLSQFYT